MITISVTEIDMHLPLDDHLVNTMFFGTQEGVGLDLQSRNMFRVIRPGQVANEAAHLEFKVKTERVDRFWQNTQNISEKFGITPTRVII